MSPHIDCPHCRGRIMFTLPDMWLEIKERVYLWYSDSSCETGRKIAAYLGIDGGTRAPNDSKTHVICWGMKRPNGWREQSGVTYLNKPSAIVENRNKRDAIQRFRNIGHINTPVTYSNDEVVRPDFNRFPIIGRRISHQGGTDAVLCLDRTSAQRAIRNGTQFFLQYIPKDAEYRVNVFGDEIFMAYEKVLGPAETHTAMTDYVWSASNGWVFSDENRTDVPQEAQEVAIGAVRAAGLMFGAVDVIHGEDGHFYALEVNTAPSLIDRRVQLYAEKFKTEIVRAR